jgi:D-3-phosphoglycerate dehydrogenase
LLSNVWRRPKRDYDVMTPCAERISGVNDFICHSRIISDQQQKLKTNYNAFMSQPIILIGHAGDLHYEIEALAPLNARIVQVGDYAPFDTLPELAECSGMIVGLQKIDGALLDKAPKCKIVSRLGVGYDNIDVEACTQRGVWAAYVPDYGIDEVSTHAIALMLTCMRGLSQHISNVRAGTWNALAPAPIKRLSDSTFGVIGYGRIGSRAAAKARGLGMRVLACDPFVSAEKIAEGGALKVSQEQLLAESDYVSVHTPLQPSTRHLINAAALAQMKPSAYLINTARGGMIDEAALAAALDAGNLRGAALDVLQQEPASADHPLVRHPRVIVTPHAAYYSEEARRDMHTRCADEVTRVLMGSTPRCPLNAV